MIIKIDELEDLPFQARLHAEQYISDPLMAYLADSYVSQAPDVVTAEAHFLGLAVPSRIGLYLKRCLPPVVAMEIEPVEV